MCNNGTCSPSVISSFLREQPMIKEADAYGNAFWVLYFGTTRNLDFTVTVSGGGETATHTIIL